MLFTHQGIDLGTHANNAYYNKDGICIIPNYAQDFLHIDPSTLHKQMTQTVPKCKADQKLQRFQCNRISASHPRMQYRGNDLKRELLFAQKKVHDGLRRYEYTGAQKEIANMTCDITDISCLQNVVETMEKYLRHDDKECDFNHYIYTWYDKPSSNISFHRDGFISETSNPSMSSTSPIAILRLGKGTRTFAICEHATKKRICTQVVTPGTLILISAEANKKYSHALFQDTHNTDQSDTEYYEKHQSGSIVLRNITKLISWSDVDKELMQIRKSRNARNQQKMINKINDIINKETSLPDKQCQLLQKAKQYLSDIKQNISASSFHDKRRRVRKLFRKALRSYNETKYRSLLLSFNKHVSRMKKERKITC